MLYTDVDCVNLAAACEQAKGWGVWYDVLPLLQLSRLHDDDALAEATRLDFPPFTVDSK